MRVHSQVLKKDRKIVESSQAGTPKLVLLWRFVINGLPFDPYTGHLICLTQSLCPLREHWHTSRLLIVHSTLLLYRSISGITWERIILNHIQPSVQPLLTHHRPPALLLGIGDGHNPLSVLIHKLVNPQPWPTPPFVSFLHNGASITPQDSVTYLQYAIIAITIPSDHLTPAQAQHSLLIGRKIVFNDMPFLYILKLAPLIPLLLWWLSCLDNLTKLTV